MQAISFFIVGAALLPYLVGSLRFEHLLVPALAGIAMLRAYRIHAETVWIVGGLMLAAGMTALASMHSYETGAMAEPVSQFVRVLMPALMMMAFSSMLPADEDASLHASKAILLISATTALFTAGSIVSPEVRGVLTMWVHDEEGGTWFNSQDIGRFTGIFNQPIEAGIFYSVGLIAAVHALRYTSMSRIVIFGCSALIIFGGAASLSKNFIVLGAACALGYAFTVRLISRAVVILLSIPIVLAAPIALEKANFNYFKSLTDLYEQGGIFAALSAGRFGYSEGSVSVLFESLWQTGDWLTGRGLGSHLPLDSAYLEYLYQGGIVSLAGYLVALTTLTLYGIWNIKSRDGVLLLVLVGYIWTASAGGPTVTANRTSVALLLLISSCMVSIRQAKATGIATRGFRWAESNRDQERSLQPG